MDVGLEPVPRRDRRDRTVVYNYRVGNDDSGPKDGVGTGTT